MDKKIIGILICILFITTTIGNQANININYTNDDELTNIKEKTSIEDLFLYEHSTTGPLPPAGCDRGLETASLDNPKIIEDVYLDTCGIMDVDQLLLVWFWDIGMERDLMT